MRFMCLLSYSLLVLGCTHPEGKKYERNQGTKSSIQESLEDSSSNQSENDNLGERVVLEMDREDGVRYVWIEINGLRLRFIFDTGASSICISSAEATVLYRQGTLREEDILNVEYFQDATGNISAGTKVNLREVKIGDFILKDVEAIIVDNVNAPLLLGQTVLERFGSIEIENDRNEIIFK